VRPSDSRISRIKPQPQTEVSSRPERSEVEGPAVHIPRCKPQTEAPPSPLSSRPERTRISCHAALDKSTCAPFRKEGRMKCINATRFHRKSGAERSGGICSAPLGLPNLPFQTSTPPVRIVLHEKSAHRNATGQRHVILAADLNLIETIAGEVFYK
jgi:hypothetical protein